MSEPENFLERWSRKKREATEPQPEADVDTGKDAVAPASVADDEKPFDIDKLPSLDSITGETDMRDFLRPGVPEDLKHEALRRAWAADPGVRDFVELLENGWDFNDPNAMAGFGPIEPSDVARLMAQFVLTAPDEKKVATGEDDKQSSPGPAGDAAAQRDKIAPPSDQVTGSDENAAAQNESDQPGLTTGPAGREPT